MIKVRLNRNLRRLIQQGHPWIYREALSVLPQARSAQLARVSDAKGDLGWAFYDPHSPLALRMLSLEKTPPTLDTYRDRFSQAWQLRSALRTQDTNCFRLWNGEGDLLPGLVCDVYDSVAVLQFDGLGPGEFWPKAEIAEWLAKNTPCTVVVEKMRRGSQEKLHLLLGELNTPERIVKENGVKFHVDLEHGQKTGFFLDQRDNRKYVQQLSAGRRVLNLFSYSGGFSLYAGLGGASQVVSVDISEGAIELARRNWILNGLDPALHVGVAQDVFLYLEEGENFDHILVDPPSMTHSEDQRTAAVAKYVSVFAKAAKRITRGGRLSLSSCSSHISFDDFFSIITEALSGARRRGRVARVSGQGFDHPFPQACHELRYLKFVDLILD